MSTLVAVVASMQKTGPERQLSRGLPSRSQRALVTCLSLYNFGLCVLLLVVLFAQFFGIIWSSATINVPIRAGRSPLLGMYTIPGYNDEPYSDRAIVCTKQGRYFQPIQLSTLLKVQVARNNTSSWMTNGIDGYRVVSRDSFTMDATDFPYYLQQCSAILKTFESIFHACETLGYNVTRDVLRIVDGVESKEVTILPDTLPVLILPYWDYGDGMRYAVPGHDGSACVFRADGMFTSEFATDMAWLRGVNRTIRESRTVEWLGYPGGVWRNGWYEDPVVHMRWYSDVISSIPKGKYGMPLRLFNLLNSGREIDCLATSCGGGVLTSRWDDEIVSELRLGLFDSVAIANGSRFGLFQFDALFTQTVTSRYSIGKLMWNVCFLVLLVRWITALVALYPLDTIGIGALSNADTFQYLPLLLLPRLKSSLTGFWTLGCRYEGPQIALESAWFEIYSAIGEVVVVLFCLLNLVAKITRRRMSDVLFGPTLLVFCGLHYFRSEIIQAKLLGIDGRIPTAVTSAELETASTLDLIFTELAFRVDGIAYKLFALKIAVVVANILPLLLGSRRVQDDVQGKNDLPAERALALQFNSNGGLGSTRSPYTQGNAAVRPYEVVRLGYIVVGSTEAGYNAVGSSRQALVLVDHWFWLLVGAAARHFTTLGFRVAIYELNGSKNASKVVSTSSITLETSGMTLTIVEITNSKLDHIAVTTIGSRPLC